MKTKTYTTEKILITLAHLLLLAWIIYVLQKGGDFSIVQIILHFTGMGLYGSGIIAGTANWAKKRT